MDNLSQAIPTDHGVELSLFLAGDLAIGRDADGEDGFSRRGRTEFGHA